MLLAFVPKRQPLSMDRPSSPTTESDTSLNSLFDEKISESTPKDIPARRVAPTNSSKISGLYFFPNLISKSLAHQVLSSVAECGYFTSSESDIPQTESQEKGPNQAMLFGRSKTRDEEGKEGSQPQTGLPIWADELVHELSKILKSKLDQDTHTLLFPEDSHRESNHFSTTTSTSNDDHPPSKRIKLASDFKSSRSLDTEQVKDGANSKADTTSRSIQPCASRQLILNLYQAGQGLSPHVDLPHRFGDGIILCSFGGATVMEFERTEPEGNAERSLKLCQDGMKGQDHREMLDSERLQQVKQLAENTNQEDRMSTTNEKQAIYLSPLSVLILKGEARYKWRHGIPSRLKDWVLDEEDWTLRKTESDPEKDQHQDNEECKARDFEGKCQDWKSRASLLERTGIRLSITIRWLLPGADVVGG